MRIPALLIACPLVAGAAAGLALPDVPGHSLALCAAGAAAFCLVAACGLFGDSDASGLVVAILSGGALSGLSLGVSSAHAAYTPELRGWFDARDATEHDQPALMEGTLREDGSLSPAGVSLTIDVLRVNSRAARGGVRLSVGGVPSAERVLEWRAGRTIRVPATVRRPAIYGNPGVPDEARALARRGIVLVGSVKSAALVDVMQKGSRLDEAAASSRLWARRRLTQHVGRWGADSGAIATAILIGDRSGLSDDDQRRLQEAGTYHVIAISGGNIAILTGLLLVLLRTTGVPMQQGAAVCIAVLLMYGELTGWSASVFRAIAAAMVFLGGRILDHRGPALNAVAVAAIAAVAVSPLAVFDAGFLLSFGATLGILLGVPRMTANVETTERGGRRRRRTHVRSLGVAIGALFIATMCAELALLPITAAVFSQVTFAGLALNFCAIPLMAVVQGASLVTLAASPWAEGVARAAGYVTHIAAFWLVRSADLVDFAPWLSLDVSPPSWLLVGAYYLCAFLCVLGTPWMRLAAGGLVLSGILMLASPVALTRDRVTPGAAGKLRIVFLDVGQGDATLVITPNSHQVLIDAGGLAGSTFDIGERVVAPALRAFGVRRLDIVVVTHGDPDHLGGAPALVERFAPSQVWEGVPVGRHLKLQEFASIATAAGLSWRTVQAGDRDRYGAVEIRVLHPPLPDWERQRVRNEDSVVLEIRMGDVSVVLPGDVGAEAEERMIRSLALGPIAIIKAPHHGSASSSTEGFVRAARPSAVVFSAGRANRFGHPARVVVERYRRAGAEMFQTNEDGAIVVDTDGRTADIWTWSGRHVSLGAR